MLEKENFFVFKGLFSINKCADNGSELFDPVNPPDLNGENTLKYVSESQKVSKCCEKFVKLL